MHFISIIIIAVLDQECICKLKFDFFLFLQKRYTLPENYAFYDRHRELHTYILDLYLENCLVSQFTVQQFISVTVYRNHTAGIINNIDFSAPVLNSKFMSIQPYHLCSARMTETIILNRKCKKHGTPESSKEE